jgi:hypothetical protein
MKIPGNRYLLLFVIFKVFEGIPRINIPRLLGLACEVGDMQADTSHLVPLLLFGACC